MMLGILASYEHIHIKFLCVSRLIPMYNYYSKGKSNLMKLAILNHSLAMPNKRKFQHNDNVDNVCIYINISR